MYDSFGSMTLTGYTDFAVFWCILLAASIGYSFVVVRSIMYFLGQCYYVSTMADDLGQTLEGLDGSLRDRKIDHTARHRALANEIQFHNDITEYELRFLATFWQFSGNFSAISGNFSAISWQLIRFLLYFLLQSSKNLRK